MPSNDSYLNGSSATPQVLIVGAGTTGLYLALALQKNGVACRIIDKLPSPGIGQRGAAIWPRTMEVMESFGFLDQIAERSMAPCTIRHYKTGSMEPTTAPLRMFPASNNTPDRPYTEAFCYGQHSHQTFLISNIFPQCGLKVEREVELVSFEQFDDYVAAKLRYIPTDTVEEVKFKYIVGCDGGKGTVRKQIGLDLKGESRLQRFVVGDLKLDDFPRDAWHLWGSQTDVSILLRPTETKGTFALLVGGAQFTNYPEIFESNESLVKFIAKIAGVEALEKAELLFSSQYNVQIRMTESFRKGRAFLAGDACHIHTPAGGQGLNSGIQDAYNLGWKIALAVKGLAQPALLDSYDQERIPVVATMLELTTGIWNKSVQDGLAKAMGSVSMRNNLNQLGINYRASGVVLDDGFETDKDARNVSPYGGDDKGRIFAGDRAPDATCLKEIGKGTSDLRLFNLFDPSRHTVLVFAADDDQGVTESLASVLKAIPSELVHIVTIRQTGVSPQGINEGNTSVVVKDTEKHASRAYQISPDGPKLFAIRPDGYIGARVHSAERIKEYFDAIIHV